MTIPLVSTSHPSKVRVGTRLTAGFALLVALTTALGLYCIRGIDRMHAAGDEVATNWFPAMNALDFRKSLPGSKVSLTHIRPLALTKRGYAVTKRVEYRRIGEGQE